MRGGTAYSSLWSDSARGRSHMFGLWGHFDREFCVEDERKKKKLGAFLKF